MKPIRRTHQGLAILKALAEARGPLTPREIHARSKNLAPNIALRTVYRKIRDLTAEGRVVGLDYPGKPPLYELVNEKGYHSHFICRQCEQVFDLKMEVERIRYTPPADFKIDGEEIVFFGICPKCAGAQ